MTWDVGGFPGRAGAIRTLESLARIEEGAQGGRPPWPPGSLLTGFFPIPGVTPGGHIHRRRTVSYSRRFLSFLRPLHARARARAAAGTAGPSEAAGQICLDRPRLRLVADQVCPAVTLAAMARQVFSLLPAHHPSIGPTGGHNGLARPFRTISHKSPNGHPRLLRSVAGRRAPGLTSLPLLLMASKASEVPV